MDTLMDDGNLELNGKGGLCSSESAPLFAPTASSVTDDEDNEQHSHAGHGQAHPHFSGRTSHRTSLAVDIDAHGGLVGNDGEARAFSAAATNNDGEELVQDKHSSSSAASLASAQSKRPTLGRRTHSSISHASSSYAHMPGHPNSTSLSNVPSIRRASMSSTTSSISSSRRASKSSQAGGMGHHRSHPYSLREHSSSSTSLAARLGTQNETYLRTRAGHSGTHSLGSMHDISDGKMDDDPQYGIGIGAPADPWSANAAGTNVYTHSRSSSISSLSSDYSHASSSAADSSEWSASELDDTSSAHHSQAHPDNNNHNNTHNIGFATPFGITSGYAHVSAQQQMGVCRAAQQPFLPSSTGIGNASNAQNLHLDYTNTPPTYTFPSFPGQQQQQVTQAGNGTGLGMQLFADPYSSSASDSSRSNSVSLSAGDVLQLNGNATANSGTTSLAFIDGAAAAAAAAGMHRSSPHVQFGNQQDGFGILPYARATVGAGILSRAHAGLVSRSSSSTPSPIDAAVAQNAPFTFPISSTNVPSSNNGTVNSLVQGVGLGLGLGIDMGMGITASGAPVHPPLVHPNILALADNVRIASTDSNTTSEKAKISFVHGWLNQSFILHPEGNVSRHALYNAYMHVCHQYHLPPINAASYGKAVRSCWVGIKTRRLGVRGASRYHYCGIRPATEAMRSLVDYYNSFDAQGRPISFPLVLSTTSALGGAGGQATLGGFAIPAHFGTSALPPSASVSAIATAISGTELSKDERGASVGAPESLVGQMGNLAGLGSYAAPARAASLSSGESNGLGSITLVAPSASGVKSAATVVKQAAPGSSNAMSLIDEMCQRPSTAYSDASSGSASYNYEENVSNIDDSSNASNDAYRLRRQTSVFSSLNEQHQDLYEAGILADLKTPTAFHFMQTSATPLQHGQASFTTPSYPGFTATSVIADRGFSLGVPSPLGFGAFGSSALAGQGLQIPQRRSSASPCTSSPGAPAHANLHGNQADSAASRLRDRRATLPNLSINVPPLRRTLSSGASVEPDDSGSGGEGEFDEGLAISEEAKAEAEAEAEDEMHAEESEDEHDEDDGLGYGGKRTARRIPMHGQAMNDTLGDDLPLPSFHELLQDYEKRYSAPGFSSPSVGMLMNAPSHAGGELKDSPETVAPSTVLLVQDGGKSNEGRSPGGVVGWNALDKANAEAIWETYKTSHCRSLLRLVRQGRLEEFEGAILLFWAQLDSAQQALVQHPLLADAMYRADALLSAVLLTQTCDKVLGVGPLEHNAIESPLDRNNDVSPINLGHLQGIGECIETWTTTALKPFESRFADCRIELASRTGHLLLRLVGVAQLAQALSGILHQPNAVDSILHAWRTLDTEMIVNQCALVTGCSQSISENYLHNFYSALEQTKEALIVAPGTTSGVNAFVAFADECLNRYATTQRNGEGNGDTSHEEDGDTDEATLHTDSAANGRSFLLKWNYLSGQVIRDLTIKSSPAFGAYQILSLFIEEYLAFKILKNVTLRSDAVTASVEADASTLPSHLARNVALHSSSSDGSNDDAAMDRVLQLQSHAAKAFLVSPHPAAHSASAMQLAQSGDQYASGPRSSSSHDPRATPTSGSFARAALAARSVADSASSSASSRYPLSAQTTPYSSTSSGSERDHQGLPVSGGSGSVTTSSAFVFPPGQPSASVYTQSFNFASALSPTTRAIFGEKTPIYLTFGHSSGIVGGGECSGSGSGSSVLGAGILPPPTPSNFSTFPALRSPGLSRFFAASADYSTRDSATSNHLALVPTPRSSRFPPMNSGSSSTAVGSAGYRGGS